MEVLYAPNDDNPNRPPTREELQIAVNAALIVADRVRAGVKTLVTCMQGRNRSGLVTALVLHILLGCSGDEAIWIVKGHRKGALMNPQFVRLLQRLKAVPQFAEVS